MSSDGKIPEKESGGELENHRRLWDSLDETIKENASVVGSSLTECKHGLENSDSEECSTEKDNEKSNGSRGHQIRSFGDIDNSSMKNEKKLTTRYFIIKSLNHNNIQLSIERGIWATQVMNEPILEEAFHNSDRVILIFSVNMSGFFQGYAQMMSPVGWRRDNAWSKSGGGNNSWGRTFKVKWLQLNDLPFQKTLHLKNPLNDYKPVKISRDCQELSEDVGEALCGLFDGEVDIKGKLKRNSPVNFEGEDCLHSAPPSHLRWPGSTVLHPPLLYQPGSPFCLESPEMLRMRESQMHRSAINRQGDNATCLQPNKRERPHEGNCAVSLSDDDILNMTYEEYLEAVGGNLVPSAHSVDSRSRQGSPTTRENNVDPYSRYLADWRHPKKVKSHHRSFH